MLLFFAIFNSFSFLFFALFSRRLLNRFAMTRAPAATDKLFCHVFINYSENGMSDLGEGRALRTLSVEAPPGGPCCKHAANPGTRQRAQTFVSVQLILVIYKWKLH